VYDTISFNLQWCAHLKSLDELRISPLVLEILENVSTTDEFGAKGFETVLSIGGYSVLENLNVVYI
jgi:hypothetical protein